jgi:hypothetical protein
MIQVDHAPLINGDGRRIGIGPKDTGVFRRTDDHPSRPRPHPDSKTFGAKTSGAKQAQSVGFRAATGQDNGFRSRLHQGRYGVTGILHGGATAATVLVDTRRVSMESKGLSHRIGHGGPYGRGGIVVQIRHGLDREKGEK